MEIYIISISKKTVLEFFIVHIYWIIKHIDFLDKLVRKHTDRVEKKTY